MFTNTVFMFSIDDLSFINYKFWSFFADIMLVIFYWYHSLTQPQTTCELTTVLHRPIYTKNHYKNDIKEKIITLYLFNMSDWREKDQLHALTLSLCCFTFQLFCLDDNNNNINNVTYCSTGVVCLVVELVHILPVTAGNYQMLSR